MFQRLATKKLLSHFSRVQLCATPQTVAHQAPPSLGFSRQEHWSGLPSPSPMCESEVTQLCLTLSDPMDCSPPGSSVHGIFQARVLEWVAIAFSKMTNLDSVLKSRDITLPTKVHIVKVTVYSVVIYRCESWTIKKTEHWKMVILNCGAGEDSWEYVGQQGDQTC